jgi:putative colanic acid biosynthesis acetyltransferase WcaF
MKLFRRPIELRDGSWVGARATLCPGTRLGIGAIVTIGSVASGDVPDYQIWAGNPARFVRFRQLTQDPADDAGASAPPTEQMNRA